MDMNLLNKAVSFIQEMDGLSVNVTSEFQNKTPYAYICKCRYRVFKFSLNIIYGFWQLV